MRRRRRPLLAESAERPELLLLAEQLVQYRAAVAVLGAGDALARRGLALALATAALVVGIETAALVAAGLLQRQLGNARGLLDLERVEVQLLHGVRRAQRGEFTGGHGPVPHRHATLVVPHAAGGAVTAGHLDV